MTAKTRFGLEGYGVRRAGSFTKTAGLPASIANAKRSSGMIGHGMGRMMIEREEEVPKNRHHDDA